jgi:hypothetical protein
VSSGTDFAAGIPDGRISSQQENFPGVSVMKRLFFVITDAVI